VRLALLELLIAALVLLAANALDPGTALGLAVAALIVQTALLVYSMTGVRSSLLERTVWRAPDATETRVALSFDDGPDPETTPRVLAVLREHRVRAWPRAPARRIPSCRSRPGRKACRRVRSAPRGPSSSPDRRPAPHRYGPTG
jgi:hypothetical protein